MIDLIIILMYLSLVSIAGVTAWAVFRTIRIVGKTSGVVHGVPVRKIQMVLCAAFLLILLLSYLFASTEPLHINTKTFADTFWLRMANMFVFTGTLSIVAAGCATLYNFIKQRR